MNRKIILNNEINLNDELYYEIIYEITSNNYLENDELIIEYIHITGKPKISIEYSEDKINYENISSQNNMLHIFSCEFLNSYSLEIY